MCNKLFIPIKAVASAGQRFAYVPCGKCYDCRESMKNSWVFRLRVELDELCKQGWQIGFFTLTYSEFHLPHVPRELFKNDDDFRSVPCFSKDDISDFFTKLKKYLLRKYNCRKVKDKFGCLVQDTAARYMLCSEYGEHTQRPHYHGIIVVPANVDMRDLHERIKRLWYHDKLFNEKFNSKNEPIEPNQKGYVFPFDFDGGYDSHGYHHNGFVCSSVKAAALYAAKYCCKDLAWYDSLFGLEFYKKITCYYDEFGQFERCYLNDNKKDYSNPLVFAPVLPSDAAYSVEYKLSRYAPFHYQSKSLGLSFLRGKSDEELLSLYKNGYSFVGDDKFQGLPVYLKNKIIFNPKYVYEIDPKTNETKRLVRREAKTFFRENLQEIFQSKIDTFKEKLSVMLSEDFYVQHNVSKTELNEFRALSIRSHSLDYIAGVYYAFYGIPAHECYNINFALQWYRRYDSDYVDITNCSLVDEFDWNNLQYELSFLFNLYAKVDKEICYEKQRNSREVNRIHDYWVSQE